MLGSLFIKWLDDRGSSRMITRRFADTGEIGAYLKRHFIFQSKYLTIFLHQFWASDPDDVHDHPWNKTWAPNPGFNGTGLVTVTATCGHIRPGEWQCNCEDQTAPCSVLVAMRAPKEPDPEITDRRGLIAAQKARKRNGR